MHEFYDSNYSYNNGLDIHPEEHDRSHSLEEQAGGKQFKQEMDPTMASVLNAGDFNEQEQFLIENQAVKQESNPPPNSQEMITPRQVGGPFIYGQTCEEYQVPESMVGLVIGRGGESIMRIQNETGCRIQMVHQKTGSQFRPCSLAGSPEQIKAARAQLDDIVSKGIIKDSQSQATGINVGGSPANNIQSAAAAAAAKAAAEAFAPGLSGLAQQITETMVIPGNKCGLIIGRQGDTIRQMQMQYKVKMMMIQEDAQPGMDKPLQITGPTAQVNNAKMAVLNLIHGPGGYSGHSGVEVNVADLFQGFPTCESIPNGMQCFVEQKAVGVIIGRQGDVIGKLQRDSGCRIQFTPENPGDAYRCCQVTGPPDGVKVALSNISDIVSNVDKGNGNVHPKFDRDQKQTYEMCIPARKVGLVVGKGGECLKQIFQRTGCKVFVENEHAKEDQYTKVLTLTAQYEEQADHARDIIQERCRLRDQDVSFMKIGKKAGFNSGMVNNLPNPNMNSLFGSSSLPNPVASAPAAMSTNFGADNSQFMQQYYQQYFANLASQQAMQNQAKNTSPGSNVAQADYSKEWAEYFQKLNELSKQQEYMNYMSEYYKQVQGMGNSDNGV